MQKPLNVSFKNMDPSDAVEARIRAKASKLERSFSRIVGCNVTVEAPHRHQKKGKLYSAHVQIELPGSDVIAAGTGRQRQAHEDVYVAIRDAFNAATRQLQDHARKMRGDVKTHESPDHGTVLRLFDDFGFAEMSDGLEVYFHRNAVAGKAFDTLQEGDEVRVVIAPEEGIEGPQASTVKPVGKHHIVTRS